MISPFSPSTRPLSSNLSLPPPPLRPPFPHKKICRPSVEYIGGEGRRHAGSNAKFIIISLGVEEVEGECQSCVCTGGSWPPDSPSRSGCYRCYHHYYNEDIDLSHPITFLFASILTSILYSCCREGLLSMFQPQVVLLPKRHQSNLRFCFPFVPLSHCSRSNLDSSFIHRIRSFPRLPQPQFHHPSPHLREDRVQSFRKLLVFEVDSVAVQDQDH